METVAIGFVASLIAGLATGVGALPILLTVNMTERFQGILLGLGGGVMLGATSFSLIVPGVEAAIAQGYSKPKAAFILSVGILLGAGLIWLAHENFPHEHFFKGQKGATRQNFERIWLFILAITLHNFPEGLAVGVGFGGENPSGGLALATGIGLQNMPEGLVVALALRNLRYSVSYSLGVSFLTGLIEPIGGIVGASVVSLAQPILPWAMAFAAGAMLFVIVDEIIPEINCKGLAQEGTFGVMTGFVAMMFMDTAFG
ncbi:MAG: ZIP family metal transporter [Hydrococcus sp. C42_A2020_068]|uniref:ZIP family metal transporter n=1 Tax=Pleurocapsa sp. PCC 7327 TaxID=118163 RepID=UPI00029FEB17|nr:ZIP family metal transporter [Pleurocapsa sp. PCC 7327]AFY79472.1 putative divalent heavy-metal cations transporter [Pleurocapsa sp. PCC 7327]MBF2021045.1 ZIP family metal transporter [Hydrococcus sp. C42_A2020_068]